MIEIYNPNPWMTWGGMGSKKLVGDNIEYIANNDSHPGAQFNSQFRNLVKSEIAKFTGAGSPGDRASRNAGVAGPAGATDTACRGAAGAAESEIWRPSPAGQIAQGEILDLPKPAEPDRVAQAVPPQPEPTSAPTSAPTNAPTNAPPEAPTKSTAFLDSLSNAVDSGELSVTPQLTPAAMMDYAKRTYGAVQVADSKED